MVDFTVEIITMGNELLIGRTVNTNANYLCLHLSKKGFKVERVTTIRDEFNSAKSAILESLNRAPQVLIISGGLGPTHDDIQLEVLSSALNVPLIEHQEAITFLREKYGPISESRRKMALVPKGSHVLKNPVGSAPGVISQSGTTHIFSLPGVPAEMKAIFQDGLVPYLESRFDLKTLVEYGFEAKGVYEAGITKLTQQLVDEFPDVNFKSHPKMSEKGYYLALHVYSATSDTNDVRTAAEKWKASIEAHFGNNVTTTNVEPVFTDSFIPE